MKRCAPHGFVEIDDAAINALSDKPGGGVPAWLVDLAVEPAQDVGDLVPPAAAGAADATVGGGKSTAQLVRDAGLDSMLKLPGEADETDPAEVLAAAARELNDAIKTIVEAEDGRHATGEELEGLGADVAAAAEEVNKVGRAAVSEKDERRWPKMEGGRLILPAGQDLASLWDWRTWWASSWALWPWGDLTPYYPRAGGDGAGGVPGAATDFREHFAYVLEREELAYPRAWGQDPPPPVEPPRWRGAKIPGHGSDHGAQDWQVTAAGHLVREKQVSGAKVVIDLEGFKKSVAALRRMTPAQWLEAAAAQGGRRARDALRDTAVHDDVKAALRLMSLVSARIPGTPAERDWQQKQLTWQTFAHGFPVAFGTPNVDTRRNPVFAAVAKGPGEGSLVDEWALGEPLVRLSDVRPELRAEWLKWGHLVAFARDPVALYEATTLAWDVWTGECLGAESVRKWRDGAACSTGFPGQCGHLVSFNGPAEDQDRGALHVHTLKYTIAERPTLAQLKRWG